LGGVTQLRQCHFHEHHINPEGINHESALSLLLGYKSRMRRENI
jgi:hypothetical protein